MILLLRRRGCDGASFRRLEQMCERCCCCVVVEVQWLFISFPMSMVISWCMNVVVSRLEEQKCRVSFPGVGKAFESWCSCRFAVLLAVCSQGSGSEAHIFIACGGDNGGDLMVRDSRYLPGPWSASVRSMLLLRNNGNENGSRAMVAAVIGVGTAGEIQG